uniref:Uncharacterized protein n=1 Tax=Aegilops tauschii subsp. strangulata TaxID=200361 RepID=A0A453IQW1_AEGTS
MIEDEHIRSFLIRKKNTARSRTSGQRRNHRVRSRLWAS